MNDPTQSMHRTYIRNSRRTLPYNMHKYDARYFDQNFRHKHLREFVCLRSERVNQSLNNFIIVWNKYMKDYDIVSHLKGLLELQTQPTHWWLNFFE